jgi:D-serine deaminase-like pyridoxal phosphate-dependent protein
VALRPHAKTHKSVRIAEMQVAEGALGVSCATLGEAEVMVADGLPGVHITSPQVTPAKITRLMALNARPHRGLSVVVDHPENLAALDAAALWAGKPLDVLVDFFAGQGRTGCADEADLVRLVRTARDAEGLVFRGIQSYSGNLQHIPNRAERRARALAELERLGGIVARIRNAGMEVPIVTGGGTGTFDLDPEARVFTELQVGSYVFMDTDYARIGGKNGGRYTEFEHSLFVLSSVISVPAADRAIVDAGLKSYSAEKGPPWVHGRDGLEVVGVSDEHGKIKVAPDAQRLSLGEQVWLIPGHCDPTVNLHEWYVGVRNGRVEALWPIEARGASI